MKLLIYFLILSFGSESMAIAQEYKNTDMKKDSDLTSSTKKILRKVGRKARDESCNWTEDRAKCISEQAEHVSLNNEDKLDTKNRRLKKAAKEHDEQIKKIEKE